MDERHSFIETNEFRKELEAELDDYVKGWKDEELFALFTECTTYLSATKNRIRALEQQGALKRIAGFFSGKNRKLKIDILKKTNHTSKILFEIVRILTHRITMVDERVDELFEDQIRIHNELLMLQKAREDMTVSWRNTMRESESWSGFFRVKGSMQLCRTAKRF